MSTDFMIIKRGLMTSPVVFFCSLAVFFCNVCYGAPWQEPVDKYEPVCGKRGGQLVLSIPGDPKSFNPITAKEASTSAITSYIFESLVTIDHITLEVKPLLAKKWEKSDDGLQWTFYLRDDVLFNDGRKMTAEDVEFTFNELVFNDAIPNSARDIFTVDGESVSVEAVDDYTVRFTVPSFFAPFLTVLGSQSVLPKHIYEPVVKKDRFNSCMGLDTSMEGVVGTGPFVLGSFYPGERIELLRNPHYWQKDACGSQLPYLERVVYLVLPDPGASLLRFMEQETDYYSLTGEDIAYLAPQQKERNFTIYNTGPSFASNFIVFNQNTDKHPQTQQYYVPLYKQKWFTDKLFRKAVALAVDRKKMIDIVFNGLGSSQHGPLTSAVSNFYNDSIEKYSRDAAGAEKILKEIGFNDRNDDGILEDQSGNILEINFYTNANSPERVLMASMIRKDLADLGIKVNFVSLEFNNLVTKLTATFDWEMMFIGFSGGSIDPQLSKNVWHSSSGLHAWFPEQDEPATEWEKEVDDIFVRAEKEQDDQKRKNLYDHWQWIINQELPVIYTVVPDTVFAVRNRFGNVFPSVYGGAFARIENVFVIDEED